MDGSAAAEKDAPAVAPVEDVVAVDVDAREAPAAVEVEAQKEGDAPTRVYALFDGGKGKVRVMRRRYGRISG